MAVIASYTNAATADRSETLQGAPRNHANAAAAPVAKPTPAAFTASSPRSSQRRGSVESGVTGGRQRRRRRHRDLHQPTVMETSSSAPTYQSLPFSCEPNRTGSVFEIAPVALVKLVLEPSTVSMIWLPLRLQVM